MDIIGKLEKYENQCLDHNQRRQSYQTKVEFNMKNPNQAPNNGYRPDTHNKIYAQIF